MRLLVPLLLLVEGLSLSQCPLGLTPEEACGSSSPICRLFNDIDGDSICNNPVPAAGEEPDTVAAPPVEEPDSASAEESPDSIGTPPQDIPDSSHATGEPDSVFTPPVEQPDTVATSPAEIPQDTLAAPTVDTAEDTLTVPANRCPLGYTPPEACSADAPGCALFVDADRDSLCDNPGPQLPSDSLFTPSDSTIRRRVLGVNGCPLNLPPAAACPLDSRLCPHWLGWSLSASCMNPSSGLSRGTAVLAITAVLLLTATFFSRRIRGRRNRKKAKLARTLFLALSLLLLGFAIQGCYCPLGLYQYLLLPGMLMGLLGWMGLVILLLPVVHALLYGRVYCGWVCPMGALQELLGRLPVKGRPTVPRRMDAQLLKLKYDLAIPFTAAVVLAGRNVLDFGWGALFCSIDPFHTIFSLFISGSLFTAVLLIILSIFFGRFFCRYLCFYGAILGLACRAGLWTRLCRLFRSREASCAEPRGEQSCELGSAKE